MDLDALRPHISQHVGPSALGGECERQQVYKFFWANDPPQFQGRLLRLFGLGHREEEQFEKMLRDIGVYVIGHEVGEGHKPPEDRKQISVRGVGGHLKGYLDGIATNLSQWLLGTEDDEPVLMEYKTYNDKRFKALNKSGVRKNDPKYYGQVVIYMGKKDLKHCLFVAINKNDHNLYWEYIPANPHAAAMYEKKAENIVYPQSLPAKIALSGTDYRCTFCDAKPVCHYNAMPRINCRTCIHSSPIQGPAWTCGHPENEYNFQMSAEYQVKGCGRHAFKPEFLPTNKVTFDADMSTISHGAYRVTGSDVVILNGYSMEDERVQTIAQFKGKPHITVLVANSENFDVVVQGVVDAMG